VHKGCTIGLPKYLIMDEAAYIDNGDEVLVLLAALGTWGRKL
jgi:hypothetical protein